MDAVQLSIFANRLSGICEEMGAVLRRSALSPNIKDRLDYSCAIFDADGALVAQAAHIPVHLGSMAYAMASLVEGRDWQRGDLLVVNDPYLGGTHLPDVTVVAPFFGASDVLLGFAVTRAHHANIGADSPGSMPVSASLDEEGVVIAPAWLKKGGRWQLEQVRRLADDPLLEDPQTSRRFADFQAQASACEVAQLRLAAVLTEQGEDWLLSGMQAMDSYAERLARTTLAELPDGDYGFEDVMDSDGQGQMDIPVCVKISVRGDSVHVDFAGTAAQVPGNINCPLSVAAAAVFYVFRCLMPPQAPACAGLFRPITLSAPPGCLVNARRPAAVAAGNVETSSRLVDVVLGALAQALPERIPAASQGTMNNLAMGQSGADGWDYYETLAGGMGAHAGGDGLSGVQSHMTNTLNTPVESLELHYPLRIWQYRVRRASGGQGRYRGGDGLIRELEVLAPASFSLLTERRAHQPWGLAGGEAGAAGENRLNGRELPAKVSGTLAPGDRLMLVTPGGGGYGCPGEQTSGH